MNLEDRIVFAQKDIKLRNDIIKDYKNYIYSCAKKSAHKEYISDHDDEVSIAMIAFDEAITKYDSSKGSFLNFANIIIRNRIIDYIRKEYKNNQVIPFTELSQTDKDGNDIEFDIEDTKSTTFDAKFELDAITNELKKYEISFFDLPKVTPKSKSTKKACYEIINYIINNPVIVNEIKNKGIIPVKIISDAVKIHRKVLERHRKYIISVIVILTGEYVLIADYFKDIKELRT